MGYLHRNLFVFVKISVFLTTINLLFDVKCIATTEHSSKKARDASKGHTALSETYNLIQSTVKSAKYHSHCFTSFNDDDVEGEILAKREKRKLKVKENSHHNGPLNKKKHENTMSPNDNIETSEMAAGCATKVKHVVDKRRLKKGSTRRSYYKRKILDEPNSEVALSTSRVLEGDIRPHNEDDMHSKMESDTSRIRRIHEHEPNGKIHSNMVLKKPNHDNTNTVSSPSMKNVKVDEDEDDEGDSDEKIDKGNLRKNSNKATKQTDDEYWDEDKDENIDDDDIGDDDVNEVGDTDDVGDISSLIGDYVDDSSEVEDVDEYAENKRDSKTSLAEEGNTAQNNGPEENVTKKCKGARKKVQKEMKNNKIKRSKLKDTEAVNEDMSFLWLENTEKYIEKK